MQGPGELGLGGEFAEHQALVAIDHLPQLCHTATGPVNSEREVDPALAEHPAEVGQPLFAPDVARVEEPQRVAGRPLRPGRQRRDCLCQGEVEPVRDRKPAAPRSWPVAPP